MADENSCAMRSICTALFAARYNPDLKQKYQAVISKGKTAKVALTALMRKLIELANTLVQKDREWTPKKVVQDTSNNIRVLQVWLLPLLVAVRASP